MTNRREGYKGVVNRISNMRERELRRSLWIAGAVLVVVVVLFFGYYFVDRYMVPRGAPAATNLSADKLEQAVRDNPQAPELRVALAQQYLKDGKNAEAVDQSSQVLAAFPDNEEALMVAGTALTRANRPQEAITRFEALAKLIEARSKTGKDINLEATYYFLGQNYNSTGQHDKALAVLETALKIDPTDADALYQAGLASQATKQYDKAVGYYNKAARLVPDFTEAYNGLIDTYTALNQPENIAWTRGMQAYSVKDYKTAQTYLESAVKAQPTNAQAYFGLALTYEKLDRKPDAFRVIQSAMQLDPENVGIQQAFGRLQTDLKAKQ